MNLFQNLDLETVSTCTRTCATCIRNSYPDREAVADWFEPRSMAVDTLEAILDQAVALGFRGQVCLSHYNEALKEERLGAMAGLVKARGLKVYCHSNGDLITPERAASLDGKLDRIVFSLYQQEMTKRVERGTWIASLFHITQVQLSYAEHLTTHFSPRPELDLRIKQVRGMACNETALHCILNHRGDYLLCCEDFLGHFDLGRFPEVSLKEYWFGERRTEIIAKLAEKGGRESYPYCQLCPRGG